MEPLRLEIMKLIEILESKELLLGTLWERIWMLLTH